MNDVIPSTKKRQYDAINEIVKVGDGAIEQGEGSGLQNFSISNGKSSSDVKRMKFTDNNDIDSNLFEDSLSSPPEVENDPALQEILQRYWGGIKTKLKKQKVVDILNIRTWDGGNKKSSLSEGIWEKLCQTWREIKFRVKLNCSVGFLLENKINGELRYFHSSANNSTLFDSPKLITSENSLQQTYKELTEMDIHERTSRLRPNTTWIVRNITNITFFFYKMLGMGKIGAAHINLPDYIKQNRHIISLDLDRHGQEFKDNLFFSLLSFASNLPV